jgi:hypothetical protein
MQSRILQQILSVPRIPKPPRFVSGCFDTLILDISVVAVKQFLPLSSISLFSTIYRRVFVDFAHAVNFISTQPFPH